MIEIDKPKIEIVDLSTQGSRSARLCDHFRED